MRKATRDARGFFVVVPGARFELARVSPYAPQTYVSTNSTTRAYVEVVRRPCGRAAFRLDQRLPLVGAGAPPLGGVEPPVAGAGAGACVGAAGSDCVLRACS